ncbi:MAG: transglutaminase domain-containing protein [Chloroflexi bacterium]|nr:transglutaminase domain-containing protein [Chloroflexota bacterium]
MLTVTPQVYYAQPGVMTYPGEFAPCLDGLPTDIPELVKVVQGLMVHVFWAERYGLNLSDERKAEVQLRTVPQKIRRLFELDNRPLAVTRPLERKLVGNCRDFSLMLCALLQHQGVPARARAGFGTYFLPNHYEDHWVCEYWDAQQGRWILVDAQLDALQREVLKPPFDPLDVPRDHFITGDRAWLMCREAGANPRDFGIFDMHGWAFVRGNVIRDFLALNQIEILPWDGWGGMERTDDEAATKNVDWIDHLARLALAGDDAFPAVRTAYEGDDRLQVPEGWQP